MSGWWDNALCGGMDPELFFPSGQFVPASAERAEDVCRRCPVATSCGLWALDQREEYGVWGGLTEKERRTIRRNAARRKAAAS